MLSVVSAFIQIAFGATALVIALFETRRRRLIHFLADATVIYPCLTICLLYIEWLLSWYMLGHRPEWSNDDPTLIPGASWMYPINGFAIMGLLPWLIAAIALNLAHIIRNRPSAPQACIRVCTLVSIWLGCLVWIMRDPHGIIEWWLD
jgi:hypothetical protein